MGVEPEHKEHDPQKPWTLLPLTDLTPLLFHTRHLTVSKVFSPITAVLHSGVPHGLNLDVFCRSVPIYFFLLSGMGYMFLCDNRPMDHKVFFSGVTLQSDNRKVQNTIVTTLKVHTGDRYLKKLLNQDLSYSLTPKKKN